MEEKTVASTPQVAVDDEKVAREEAVQNGVSAPIPPQHRHLHDPDVSFEEYYYYALQARAEEETLEPPKVGKNWLAFLIPNLQAQPNANPEGLAPEININDRSKRLHITDEEWTNASRAMRNASAGAIFYLVTTDVLGPYALPYAFATTGWG